ncbi:hypothetical protein GOP47_0007573 [Adiantum capillus-veneris]|uniref:Uncharacterized protein n=1 Tax=Adiantum capillus-veneris TaxID=13818 RepID=A0A9D4V1A5_ADICA|nr:hypothetical protein GOP47_0007573 [Adiantum capillus-veneris]
MVWHLHEAYSSLVADHGVSHIAGSVHWSAYCLLHLLDCRRCGLKYGEAVVSFHFLTLDEVFFVGDLVRIIEEASGRSAWPIKDCACLSSTVLMLACLQQREAEDGLTVKGWICIDDGLLCPRPIMLAGVSTVRTCGFESTNDLVDVESFITSIALTQANFRLAVAMQQETSHVQGHRHLLSNSLFQDVSVETYLAAHHPLCYSAGVRFQDSYYCSAFVMDAWFHGRVRCSLSLLENDITSLGVAEGMQEEDIDCLWDLAFGVCKISGGSPTAASCKRISTHSQEQLYYLYTSSFCTTVQCYMEWSPSCTVLNTCPFTGSTL